MICGLLTQGCSDTTCGAEEYFHVEIEATLCSFSTINYSQALRHNVQYMASYHKGFLESVHPNKQLETNPFVMS